MKNLIFVIIVVGSVMIFFGCQEDGALSPVVNQSDQGSDYLAKKPAPNLTGTMDLYFNFVNPVWVGTITFEEHGTYEMRFFSLLPQRDYSQARPFEEDFEIYKLIDGVEKIYLRGHDKGVTTLANSKYRMNGEILEANEPFEGWLGHKVHMSGVITWQNLGTPEEPVIAPATAPGTFRIN